MLFIIVLQFLIIVPYVYSCMVDWHISSLWSSQTIIVEPSYFDWLYVEVRANGDVVDYMRITFKIVEEGYGIKFESINVAGILIVLISVSILAVIVWRFKRYRSSLTHQAPFTLK